MRVPTADYSPIEQANRSKYNAIKAGYAAKDAANWKTRDEHAEKGLSLQRQSLDLSTRSATIQGVLSMASYAGNIAMELYDMKQRHDREAAQQYLDTDFQVGFTEAQQKDQQAGQDGVDQWTDEDGNVNVNPGENPPQDAGGDGTGTEAQPSAVDQWEQDAYENIDKQHWSKKTKEWARGQVQRVIAGQTVERIQGEMAAYEQQTAQLYQNNLQNDFAIEASGFSEALDISFTTAKGEAGREGMSFSDHINGDIDGIRERIEAAVPEQANQRTIAFVGQGMTAEQAQAYAAPFLAQNGEAYQDMLYRGVLNQALDRDGLSAATEMVDKLLPERYGQEERDEIRKGLRTRQTALVSSAKAEGSGLAAEHIKAGNVSGESYKETMSSFDAKGVNAEVTEAYKQAYATGMYDTVMAGLVTRLDEASSADGIRTSLEKTREVGDWIEQSGYFDDRYLPASVAKALVEKQYADESTAWGEECTAEFQLRWGQGMDAYLRGEISLDAFLSQMSRWAEEQADTSLAGVDVLTLFNRAKDELIESKKEFIDKNFRDDIDMFFKGISAYDINTGKIDGQVPTAEQIGEVLYYKGEHARLCGKALDWLMGIDGPPDKDAWNAFCLDEMGAYARNWQSYEAYRNSIGGMPTSTKDAGKMLTSLLSQSDVKALADGFSEVIFSDGARQAQWDNLVRYVYDELHLTYGDGLSPVPSVKVNEDGGIVLSFSYGGRSGGRVNVIPFRVEWDAGTDKALAVPMPVMSSPDGQGTGRTVPQAPSLSDFGAGNAQDMPSQEDVKAVQDAVYLGSGGKILYKGPNDIELDYEALDKLVPGDLPEDELAIYLMPYMKESSKVTDASLAATGLAMYRRAQRGEKR